MTSHHFVTPADPRLRARTTAGPQGAQPFHQVLNQPPVPMTSHYPVHVQSPIPPLFRGAPPPPLPLVPPPPNFHGLPQHGMHQYGHVGDAPQTRLQSPPISPQPHPHLWRLHPLPVPLPPAVHTPSPRPSHLATVPFTPRMMDHFQMGVASYYPLALPPGMPVPSSSHLVPDTSHHPLVDPFVKNWLEGVSIHQPSNENASVGHLKVSINKNLQQHHNTTFFVYIRTCFFFLYCS